MSLCTYINIHTYITYLYMCVCLGSLTMAGGWHRPEWACGGAEERPSKARRAGDPIKVTPLHVSGVDPAASPNQRGRTIPQVPSSSQAQKFKRGPMISSFNI